ncbi:hypothetical protein MLD38_001807 [Melastoma candidum]|uniref:Uncharacterized protein n=1 Tax=Melastoma candidum TaxID=119954 RepID=A0ACB9SFQ0_9MYRT|nr:hypothetical protein MLD38_001807 [Melastoma candidum]
MDQTSQLLRPGYLQWASSFSDETTSSDSQKSIPVPKAKVRRLVFTSSAGTVDVQSTQKPVYDENSWSNPNFARSVEMTVWVHKKFFEIWIVLILIVGPFVVTVCCRMHNLNGRSSSAAGRRVAEDVPTNNEDAGRIKVAATT